MHKIPKNIIEKVDKLAPLTHKPAAQQHRVGNRQNSANNDQPERFLLQQDMNHL